MTEKSGENINRSAEEILIGLRKRRLPERIARAKAKVDEMSAEEIRIWANEIRENNGPEMLARQSVSFDEPSEYYQAALAKLSYILEKEKSLGDPYNNNPN